MIHYEDFERERLDPIYDVIAPYSEMEKNERYFLNGMIRYLKPQKILEVGVYKGGGTAIILNAISDIDGAKLYSVDRLEEVDIDGIIKPVGAVVSEKFPDLMGKWQIFKGRDTSCYVDDIGGDVDLLVLDTAHIHPWETLNFICVLPLLKTGAYVILHDITLHYMKMIVRNHLACRYLFGHVVSDEKFSPASDHEGLPSNIGAFRISDDTKKYAGNLFESLFIPWESEVSEEDFDDIGKVIRKYYSPEQYKFFLEAFRFQESLNSQDQKESFYDSLKTFVKCWQPGLFASLKKMKHSMNKQ